MIDPKTIASEYALTLSEYRRYLHMHPEPTNKEYNTSVWIKAKLRESNIPFKDGIRGNSVVAYIDGGRPGPCIAFRGDMDALPIEECNNVPYKSTNPGVMHACGHDAHTAILLCLAQLFSANRDIIKGRVVFLFQEAEEGGGGAERLVSDGAMEGIDKVFALHVAPELSVGTVSLSAGVQNASSDTFSIEITGKGTHGATPHLGIDPITTGCTIVTELSLIRSKLFDALEPFLINVCQFTSGYADNVAPETAVIKGTVRCLSEELRSQVQSHIERISRSVCSMKGCKCSITYNRVAPVLINSKEEAELAAKAISECGYTVESLAAPRLIAEDFACLLKEAPGCIFALGCGNADKGLTASLHSPNFDMDEACLQVGLECMLAIYLKLTESR